MRLWSLHPRYLDAKGLTACWREGLLARSVLRGETSGYKQHPQLERFRHAPDPLAAIEAYLGGILDEAVKRGYRFDASKITRYPEIPRIAVTEGQLLYEREHCARNCPYGMPRRWNGSGGREHPQSIRCSPWYPERSSLGNDPCPGWAGKDNAYGSK